MTELVYGVCLIIAFAAGWWARGPSASATNPVDNDSANWWKNGGEPPEWKS